MANFEEATSMRRAGCDGYLLFTPERSGTYSLLVSAAQRSHVQQPYHLQVAPARADDTSPGPPLRNFARRSGPLKQ